MKALGIGLIFMSDSILCYGVASVVTWYSVTVCNMAVTHGMNCHPVSLIGRNSSCRRTDEMSRQSLKQQDP